MTKKTTKKASKAPAKQQPAPNSAKVRSLTGTARAALGRGCIDIYPDVPRSVSILNEQVLILPVNLEIELKGLSGLIIPHPQTAQEINVFPAVINAFIAEGTNKIDVLRVQNQGGRQQYVSRDTPIARIVLLTAVTLSPEFDND